MDNDDQQLGRILSRREVLALLGAAGTTLLVGCAPPSEGSPTAPPATAAAAAPTAAPTAPPAPTATMAESRPAAQATPAAVAPSPEPASTAAPVPACVVRPEGTEGPYYVDEGLVRFDVRTDSVTGEAQAGAPLLLTFRVAQVSAGGCAPLAGAIVDIWHCNALGAYSDVTDRSFDTSGQDWLRGSQVTDANGAASFTTIYPGWYPGRAVHIHFKIRPGPNSAFTSQLFFDEALTDQVHAQEPYSSRGRRDRLNSNDGIYEELLLLTTVPSGDGYAATFEIGLAEV